MKFQLLMLVLLTASVASFADDLKPTDALDISTVGISAKFIPIKAGNFLMGSPVSEWSVDGGPVQHPVTLTQDYEIQATDVTQLQYFLVSGTNPSTFVNQENCDADNYKVISGNKLCINHPVENVSWQDAQKFVLKINSLQNTYTYRLPTEAEWEYAARGGKSVLPYSLSEPNQIDQYAWYDINSKNRTHAVGLKKANEYGLYDVGGNVWRWVQDYYQTFTTATTVDPKGPASEPFDLHVLRGSGYLAGTEFLVLGSRSPAPSNFVSQGIGFRLARSLK